MRNVIDIICKTDQKPFQQVFSDSPAIYTFLNPVSYLTARKNRIIYLKFSGIFVDGSILVLFIKLFYGIRIKRLSFDMTSMAPMLFDYSLEHNKTIYLIGSKEQEIREALSILKRRIPKLKIIGSRNGYFLSKIEKEQEIDKIIRHDPDYVIVGMGAIAQEQFLILLKEKGYKGVGFTCGGFLHQTSKNTIEFYPKWANKWNIRFVYRMYKEKHTRKRYLQAALLFPFMFIYDKFLAS